MNKNILWSIIALLSVNALLAQDELKAPTQELLKLPVAPTPNAAALGKFGDIPVGLSTGIPSVSIPFYYYQDPFKKLSLPIGLNYHAGGHKLEDMASNCGLGWALDAGGMITRTMNGLPDDGVWGYLSMDTMRYFYTQSAGSNFQYLSPFYSIGTNVAITKDEDINAWLLVRDIQDRFKDGEADMFSFNAAGISGKFFIRKSFEVQLITQSNVTVILDTTINQFSVTINGFTILDKNTGISYVFDVTETTNPNTINIQTQFGPPEPYSVLPSYTSSWHLSKIISADASDTIKFHYSSSTVSYEAGFSQSVTGQLAGPLSSGELNVHDAQFSHTLIYNTSRHVRYIELPDKTTVTFYYNFPRADLQGDSALTSIKIKNGDFEKIYNLSYGYFESPSCPLSESYCSVYDSDNDYYKRLKLLQVQQSDGTNTLPAYLFEYNSTPLATRKSMSQDYWGYYRGGISTSLIPLLKIAELPVMYPLMGEANREPSEQYTKAWILEKITYPTGGATKFYYEINTAFGEDYSIHNRLDTTTITQSSYNQFVSLPFTGRTDTEVKLTIKLFADTSTHEEPEVPWGCNFNYVIKATDNSYSDTVTATIEEFLNGYAATVELPLNKTYEIKYTSECAWLPDTYYMDIYFEYEIVPLDKPVGGLRVSKIEDYDSVNATPLVRNYTYLGTDGHSSGEFQHFPNSHYYFSATNEWQFDEFGQPLAFSYPRWFIHRSSTPSQSLSYFRGSAVIYKRVKVDKTVNEVSNGYTIHEFSTFASTQILTTDYPFVQKQDLEWRQGLPLKDSVYTATGQLVQTEENDYDYFEIAPTNGYGRNLLTSLIQSDNLNTEVNIVYGARAYYYTSGRAELRQKKTKIFKGTDAVETVVDYAYYPSNYLISNQRTKNSVGDSLETRFYYPGNYTSTGLPEDVTGDNGEAEIVSQEAWLKKGGTWYLARATVNDYGPFNSVVRKNKIIATELKEPLNVSVIGTFDADDLTRHSSFKDQVEILSYDDLGRFTEVQMSNKPVSSFIWSAERNYPIATATNASQSHIAYTSFETTDAGNWSGIGSGYIQSTGGITGNKFYSQSSFSLSKAGLTSGSYYLVTYWSKDGPYSVSGTQGGYPKTLKSVSSGGGNWTLYEHLSTGQTTITISGSGALDELRLHPREAQMTTQTFKPLVGVSSICDVNNMITYYEYDAFGRLMLVRNSDGHILKKICYNYAGQLENCNFFGNVQKSGNFTKNNCSAGTGTQVNYVVAANTHFSAESQADADAKAQNDVNQNGQSYANANGACIFYNVQKSGSFTRNNCGTGGVGGNVNYIVPAGTYNSAESQAAADQLAQNDVNANGQAYANANGTCTYYNEVQSGNFTRNNCSAGYTGTQVTYTVPAGTYSSGVSLAAANQLAINAVNANGQAYANANGSCNCSVVLCTGSGKKCVNNICETGIKVYTASEYNSMTGFYDCTYHYEWSDSSWSQDFVEQSPADCPLF